MRSLNQLSHCAREGLIKFACDNLRRSRGLDDRAMAQSSFAELSKRRTRRELFLEKMDNWFPGSGWSDGSSRSIRRPYPLSVMLRVHCVQLFYNQRPGDGGPSLRGGVGEAFRGAAVDGGAARRDHHPELPYLLESTAWARVCSRRSMRTWRRAAIGCARGRSLTRIIDAPSSTKNRRTRTGP